MFVLIALLTLAAIGYIALRHWILSMRLSALTVQQTLRKVSQHLSVKEWDLAASKLIPLLENKRGGQRALLYEIRILRQKKAFREAKEKVAKAKHLYPKELAFSMEEGKILLKLGQPRKALDALERSVSILRREEDIYAYSSALLQSGFAKEAIEKLKPWLKENAEGKLFSLAAWAYFEMREFGKTISYYCAAIERGFTSHKLLIQLGHAYRRHGNLQEAEEIFRRLLEQDSLDIAALLGLGNCLQERGQHQKALLIYQSGKLWEQEDDRLLLQAGICAINLSKYDYAESYFSKLNASDPHPKTLAYLGYALEKQEKWQEAESCYRQIINEHPANPNGYRALAWMFGIGVSTTLSQEQAINFAHIALNIAPDAITWEILSACEARIGNFKRAYEIQLTLAKNDQDRESRFRRQRALRKLRSSMPLNSTHVVHTLVA